MYPKTRRQSYSFFWKCGEAFHEVGLRFRDTVRDILMIFFQRLLMFQTEKVLIRN